MAYQTHISLASVDEKIDYFISQNEEDYHEQGPSARQELYEFITAGIADGNFADPAAVCAHVRRRLLEYAEW